MECCSGGVVENGNLLGLVGVVGGGGGDDGGREVPMLLVELGVVPVWVLVLGVCPSEPVVDPCPEGVWSVVPLAGVAGLDWIGGAVGGRPGRQSQKKKKRTHAHTYNQHKKESLSDL